MMRTYEEFLARKTHLAEDCGFAPSSLPGFLFDFQSHLVEWALRKGRAALFEDCGLGKTPQQLVWAEAVAKHANKPVLILTPIAVGIQTVAEGQKFGIEVIRSRDGSVHWPITVTNYERLHLFKRDDWAGVVCDESSILKNFKGATRAAITEFVRPIPYRLLCTATAAPNDYIEFGTSSEALGNLGYMDMLGMFFDNDDGSLHPSRRMRSQAGWYFKPHAEQPFWRWLCSWARALRQPADLGFHDGRFLLPPLTVNDHTVCASRSMTDYLFTVPASGLSEERQERRHTIRERCEQVAVLSETGQPMIAWCYLNEEGDLLEKLMPDAVQVSGRDSDEEKEEKLTAFTAGQIRVLVTKPMLAGFGLNWQHCAHMTFFPSHSWEQYYQAVRRCWRFGQTQPVIVDIVKTEGEANVMANLKRKADAAEHAFRRIVKAMGHELSIARKSYAGIPMEVPTWLR